MELPEEVVVLILEKLRLPELGCAILVCKSWKNWVLKERLYLCPILWVRRKDESLLTRALVNKEWYEISMRFVMDAQSLNHRPNAKYKRLHESLVNLHENRLVYILAEEEEGAEPVKQSMVLSSNFWTRSVVKELHPVFSPSRGLRLIRYASVWMDNRDPTGFSYKVLLFFHYFSILEDPKDGFVMAFDSYKDEWTRATANCDGSDLEAPLVKGNRCYALNGCKLVFYDFEAGGVFQDLAAFPSLIIYANNLMVEFQKQLLLTEEATFSTSITIHMMELRAAGAGISKVCEVCFQGELSFVSGIKVGKDKLYIAYNSDGQFKLMEWSVEETRDVCLPEIQGENSNTCIW